MKKPLYFIILLCCSGCLGFRDLTPKEYSTGEEVVDATIALLDLQFNSPNLFWTEGDDSVFFKQLALVESNYGTAEDTFTEANLGGIWQVEERDFEATQDRFFLRRNPEFAAILEAISDNYGLTWADIEFSELAKPVISLVAARVVLHYKSFVASEMCSFLPTSDEQDSYAEYWFECYRNGERGKVEDFNQNTGPTAEESSCNVAADVMFVLDSSGSINFAHPDNWDRVRYFTGNFTAGLLTNSSTNQNRVGIITFSFTATIHSLLTGNRERILNDIATLPFDGYTTNTADGLCQLLDINWAGEDRLRLVIVMTDGKSSDVSDRCGTTLQAPIFVNAALCPEPLYYVIGVTDNVNQTELEAIATGPEYIDHLDSLESTAKLEEFRRTRAYQICFKASSFLCDETISKTNLGRGDRTRYQIEITEGVTVRLIVNSGQVALYASTQITTPNNALNDFAFEKGIMEKGAEDLFVTPEALATLREMKPSRRKRQVATPTNTILYISIEGIGDNSSFTLETPTGNSSTFSVSCSDNPCGVNTVCIPNAVSYSCACIPGYQFSDNLVDCEEVNECLRVPSVCHIFANCINTRGGYTCSCQEGYKGDGNSCYIERVPQILVIVTAISAVIGTLLLLVVVAAALVNIHLLSKRGKSTTPEEKTMKENLYKIDLTS